MDKSKKKKVAVPLKKLALKELTLAQLTAVVGGASNPGSRFN